MPASTNQHYSHDNAFFAGFLDPYMKYSSGLFDLEQEEPLDVGIERMIDYLLEAGRLKRGARVLDIGNGWGCLLKRMRERVDVDYTGVNPSEEQLAWIREHVDPRAHLLLGTFDEAAPSLGGQYDTIYMVGALCHIAEQQRSLRQLSELLVDGGVLVIEDTFFLSEALYQKHASRPETRFVQDTVFGFAHVTSLATMVDDLRAAGLRMVRTLDNSHSYERTIDLWCERLRQMEDARFPLARQAVEYMDIFQRGWGYTICNHVMVVEKLPARRRKRADVP